jgi:hypothetical protein
MNEYTKSKWEIGDEVIVARQAFIASMQYSGGDSKYSIIADVPTSHVTQEIAKANARLIVALCSEGRGLRLAEKILNTEDVLMHQEGLILCPFCLHEIHLSPYHEPDCDYRNMLALAREILEANKE